MIFPKKGFKESLFRHFTAFECVFMYTPIHIYMYSRPHEYNEIIYGMGKSITNSNCEYTVYGMCGRKIDEYLNRLKSALYINKADSNL